jgi:hypothetical protein
VRVCVMCVCVCVVCVCGVRVCDWPEEKIKRGCEKEGGEGA